MADQIGYTTEQGDAVDYVYLGLGIIVGVLMGMVEVPLAGAPVSLGTGGGCLLSGLMSSWARGKFPAFGSLPTATEARTCATSALRSSLQPSGWRSGRRL